MSRLPDRALEALRDSARTAGKIFARQNE